MWSYTFSEVGPPESSEQAGSWSSLFLFPVSVTHHTARPTTVTAPQGFGSHVASGWPDICCLFLLYRKRVKRNFALVFVFFYPQRRGVDFSMPSLFKWGFSPQWPVRRWKMSDIGDVSTGEGHLVVKNCILHLLGDRPLPSWFWWRWAYVPL